MEPLFLGVFVLWLISRSNMNLSSDQITDRWEPVQYTEFELVWESDGLQRKMFMDKLVRTTVVTSPDPDAAVETTPTIIAYRLWVTGDNLARRYPNPNNPDGTLHHGWNNSWKFETFAQAAAAGQAWIDGSTSQPEGDPIPPVAPLPPSTPDDGEVGPDAPPTLPPSGEPLPPAGPPSGGVPSSPLLSNSGVNALNGQDLQYVGW